MLTGDFPSLAGRGAISIDTETHDPDLAFGASGVWAGKTKLAGVSVATEDGSVKQYYPVGHDEGFNHDKKKVVAWLKQELKTSTPKVGANLLYDAQILEAEGIKLGGPLYDVQIAEPLLVEDRFNYGLGPIAKDYTGRGKKTEDLKEYLVERFGRKNHMSHIGKAPSEVVAPYAIDDAALPLEIFAKQKPELEKQNLWGLFEMESKLIPMLVQMRKRGIRVDVAAAERMRDRMKRKYADLIAEIKRQTGVEVQPWAADSFKKIFDDQSIPYPLTPKTKKPSFTASFLENCEHPSAQMIVEARRLDKMVGTFLEGSILERHHRGRIHCNFNQLKGEGGGAVSGRFSSSAPNLQFIPVRTEDGKMLRAIFVADEGQDFYHLDYSQIEFRLLVHDAAFLKLPGAEGIAKQYREDPETDFHDVVAEMTGLGRSAAKTVNFGIAYGEGKDKLARSLGLSVEGAEELLVQYHRRAPFMKPLSQGFMREASTTGIVRTLMGRVRRFEAWERYDPKEKKSVVTRHRMPGARRAFTHKALNARTQGSAADVMKAGMVDVWESGVCDVLGPPQLTVHDELDGSAERSCAGREAVREMKRIMEQTVKLLVPLRVDADIGPNWGNLSPLPEREEVRRRVRA